MIIILVVALIAVIIFKYHWDRRKCYQTSWRMTGPPALPIVGNAIMFLDNSSGFYENFYNMFACISSVGRRLFVNDEFKQKFRIDFFLNFNMWD